MTMGFFGMVFWLIVLWFVFRAIRRRERWAAMGPWAYGPYGWHPRPWEARSRQIESPEGKAKRGDQQEYIDALETRVSELEERLDFTERLVAGRKDSN